MVSRLPIREGRYRFSVAHLLTALIVLFVVTPFVERWSYGALVESVVFTLMMLAAVNAVGGRRQTQLAAAALAAPALLARWVHHVWPESLMHDLSLLTAVAFVAFVIWHLFRYVILAQVVNSEVLCAAISIYLLFAVGWAFLFTILARWDPNAFTFTVAADAKQTLESFTALYFSVQIVTTITFGDILPVSNVARMMAIVEAALGVFYMAILISRLVGLYTGQGPPERPGDERDSCCANA